MNKIISNIEPSATDFLEKAKETIGKNRPGMTFNFLRTAKLLDERITQNDSWISLSEQLTVLRDENNLNLAIKIEDLISENSMAFAKSKLEAYAKSHPGFNLSEVFNLLKQLIVNAEQKYFTNKIQALKQDIPLLDSAKIKIRFNGIKKISFASSETGKRLIADLAKELLANGIDIVFYALGDQNNQGTTESKALFYLNQASIAFDESNENQAQSFLVQALKNDPEIVSNSLYTEVEDGLKKKIASTVENSSNQIIENIEKNRLGSVDRIITQLCNLPGFFASPKHEELVGIIYSAKRDRRLVKVDKHFKIVAKHLRNTKKGKNEQSPSLLKRSVNALILLSDFMHSPVHEKLLKLLANQSFVKVDLPPVDTNYPIEQKRLSYMKYLYKLTAEALEEKELEKATQWIETIETKYPEEIGSASFNETKYMVENQGELLSFSEKVGITDKKISNVADEIRNGDFKLANEYLLFFLKHCPKEINNPSVLAAQKLIREHIESELINIRKIQVVRPAEAGFLLVTLVKNYKLDANDILVREIAEELALDLN